MGVITRRALIQRINRALKKDYEVLKTARSEVARSEFGDHFILDAWNNTVAYDHVDIESLGRDLKVMAQQEALSG